MRRILLYVCIAALLVIAALYHWLGDSRNDLNVDPHAAGEIEKAKRR